MTLSTGQVGAQCYSVNAIQCGERILQKPEAVYGLMPERYTPPATQIK